MASAVARSQASNRNQALNTLRLRRIHKDTSGLRKQVRPAENVFRVWRYSKRLNDRVNAFQRSSTVPRSSASLSSFSSRGSCKCIEVAERANARTECPALSASLTVSRPIPLLAPTIRTVLIGQAIAAPPPA